MSLILLIGLQLGSPLLYFFDPIFVRLKILLMALPFLHERVDCRRSVLQHPFCLLQWSLDNVKPLWNLSTFVFDLHNTEIKLLQLDEWRKILVQCTPIFYGDRADIVATPRRRPRWWAH